MAKWLLLLALTPSWAAPEVCQTFAVNCASRGMFCDDMDNLDMQNHTYTGCAQPLVCAGKNMTCRDKPMVGLECQDDEDCWWLGQTGDKLYCDKSGGGTPMCAARALANPPTPGCRANQDPCTMDTECAWGKCTNGKCAGLLAGANCSDTNLWGCAWNLFCWDDGTSSTCVARKAAGQQAVWASEGSFQRSCMSGYFRNTTGTPMCVSYDGMWGTLADGMQCYKQDLPEADYLCRDGSYCGSNSQCTKDNDLAMTCDIASDDCSKNLNRNSNGGSCHCLAAGSAPTCIRPNCGSAGAQAAMQIAASSKCGGIPMPGMGRCLAGNYDTAWRDSCSNRAQACYASKSYMQCWANFEYTNLRKVLVPNGMACGMSLNKPIMWESYCSSASVTQPLFLVVIGLMALLRL